MARVISGVSTTVMPARTRVLLTAAVAGDMASSLLDEGEQVRVHLILERRGKAVRRARVVDLLRAPDESGRLPGGVLDRNDLVVLAVKDQSRDIELPEILGEIGLGEGLDALVGVLQAGLHAPGPELVQDPLGDFRSRPIGAIELDCQVLVELRAVLG